MHRGIALALVLACACHVTTTTELTRPTVTERITLVDQASARPPTLVLTDTGRLRFVEPLDCPSEELVATTTTIEKATGPNLATFVVGVIVTAAGGVLAVRGMTSDDRSNASTYAGAGALAVGLPLTFGPWIGHRKELHPGPASPPVRRGGPSEPCGERALPATSATLAVHGLEVHGTVDADGVFAISPYQLVDAYAATEVPAWDVRATVDTPSGPRTIEVVIEGGALATRAAAFLARADFDARIEPLRLVPGLVAGTLRASLTTTERGPALRLVLPVKNEGPGEAWALRGRIASTARAVDGRVLYIGHLARGAQVTSELLIPLSTAAADELRGSTLDVSLVLRDAHGTAPETPVRFRGLVMGDAPR